MSLDLSRIHAILDATTTPRARGEGDPVPDGLVRVDVHFHVVDVDRAAAEAHREDLVAILDAWPEPYELLAGPNYLTICGRLDSQAAALRLFALGEALDLWRVLTPGRAGIVGAEADTIAGRGGVGFTFYTSTLARVASKLLDVFVETSMPLDVPTLVARSGFDAASVERGLARMVSHKVIEFHLGERHYLLTELGRDLVARRTEARRRAAHVEGDLR